MKAQGGSALRKPTATAGSITTGSQPIQGEGLEILRDCAGFVSASGKSASLQTFEFRKQSAEVLCLAARSFEQAPCGKNARGSESECIRLSRSFPNNDVCPMESRSLRQLASEAARQTRFQSAAGATSEILTSRQWLASGLRVPRRRGNLEYQFARCECVRALRPKS